MWNSARKLRGNHMIINPNNRSKRTMVRHHEPCDTTVMAVNQYDVSSERAVLVNTCRDEVPSKEGQLEETPLVSINATVADSRSYEMPPESTDSFLPSQRHNNTTVQRTDSQNYRQSENKIGTFELKRDSTHSSSPICNENCHAERCRAVYTPELYANPSHDISSDIVAPTSHICNGSLASSQVCSRRPSYRFGVYPLRRPRRLLPSYHVPSPPTDLSAVPLQRPIVRPSPRRRLHPLSVAEAEFIFAKQPMLQYSPFRHLPIWARRFSPFRSVSPFPEEDKTATLIGMRRFRQERYLCQKCWWKKLQCPLTVTILASVLWWFLILWWILCFPKAPVRI